MDKLNRSICYEKKKKFKIASSSQAGRIKILLPLFVARVLIASGLAPSASYSALLPLLHPTPGVLQCSRLASLPAAVLPAAEAEARVLPLEPVEKDLLWLPVKSLIRFRCSDFETDRVEPSQLLTLLHHSEPTSHGELINFNHSPSSDFHETLQASSPSIVQPPWERRSLRHAATPPPSLALLASSSFQMSGAPDSPIHSSSSDDFIAYLDEALAASLPDASSDKEVENQDELESVRIKRRKFESDEETEESTSEGSVKQSLEESVEDVCSHPGSFGDMCIRCGQKLDGESGVTFGYIHKGLRLHDQEISRLRNTDANNLRSRRKLYLILDLDHTLLNSTHLAHLNSEELHLISQADSVGGVSKSSLFKLEKMHMMTKLRPFVRTFLREASEMFEMYIYTMGDRPYALEMAKLLDPQGEYFNAKVISRDDGTQKHQKGLDIVLGQESAVVILDDTEHAWVKHKDNLILMERYHFFGSSCRQFGFNCKSLAELKSDEDEAEGALSKILKVLKQIHYKFFYELEDIAERDVRQVLKSLRREVLSGCVIVFSRIFHGALPSLRKMAEQLGATCLTELDPSVTHVVATDAGTEKARWAVKEKRFLVHPRWIEAANYFWEKQPEENFVLKKKQ
ncbi:hypothetical protein AHAS_Ahas08G0061900 [Arachis hypogaea]